MRKKIFVGNLPFQTDEVQLREWFTTNGFPTESVELSTDKLSGHSRGFGYVEMNAKLAERCILACNGMDFLGRNLIINHVSPPTGRSSNKGRRPSRGQTSSDS